MPLGQDVEIPGAHAFRLRRAEDMIRKMRRELRYFREAGGDRNKLTDHAINFALTAWHTTDWVWQQHERRLRDEGVACCLRCFQSYARRKSKALAVCDVIANAAKHGGEAHASKGRPKVSTILVAQGVDDSLPDVELFAAMEKRAWSLKIAIDGKPTHAIVVFNSAASFWHKFRGDYFQSN